MNIIKPVKGFTKKIAALVSGPRAAVSFVCKICCGVLGANTTVITRIARRISLSVWALHKRLERFEALFEQGLIQLRFHAHAERLVKRMYRAHKYIPVILDYCTVRGSFGVGRVKPKKEGEKPPQGFDLLVFGVPVEGRCVILYYEVHTQHDPEALCTSRNLMIIEAIKKVCALAKIPKERLIFVMDRGFANENILNSLNDLGLNYICRVRLDVTVTEEPEKSRKTKRFIRGVASETEEGCATVSSMYYKGRVPIRLVIKRDRAHCEPLALAVSPCLEIASELAVSFYFKRMQIEETFRDLKSQHMNIEKMRLKKFSRVEILLSLLIMAYNVLIELGICLLRQKRSQAKILRARLSIVSIVCDQIFSIICWSKIVLREI